MKREHFVIIFALKCVFYYLLHAENSEINYIQIKYG